MGISNHGPSMANRNLDFHPSQIEGGLTAERAIDNKDNGQYSV
jgi:hypothetical protein